MKRHIWIINEYAGSPYHGMEFRHFYIGKELVNRGYRVTIVSSSFSHLFRMLPNTSREKIHGVDYVWLRTFNYKNAYNKLRAIKWFVFCLQVCRLPFIIDRPDLIICSPMASFVAIPSWVLAKLYNVKLFFEVKDIWPLSLIEFGGYSPNNLFIKFMSCAERFAIKKCDIIISNLKNYNVYLTDLNIKKNFHWISNGIDLEEMNQSEPLADKYSELIPKDKFIIGYAGSVGRTNALEALLDSLPLIDNPKIVIAIVGEGWYKERLVEKYGADNRIYFIPAVPKKQVSILLSHFDVCYIGLIKREIFKYGVSPNKLFDYMLSAKPIIYSINSLHSIVAEAKCGINVEAENSTQVAKAIEKIYAMPIEQRIKMGQAGKEYVLNNFTYDHLSSDLQKLIENKLRQ